MKKLLEWYDENRRSLPWRQTRDPYRIWLSEIMLQQTQVQTAVPYYLAFVDRFPTVEALAAAPLEEVLALWSGLGYYRRARWLHQTAKTVSGGEFPRSAAELATLPGIGPYTAAAVASIAFDEPVPVLDGNVERVLCRLLAIDQDPKSQPVRRRLLHHAATHLDRKRPGDANQALMELGSQICRPRGPACPRCPLSPRCAAFAEGDPERFPRPRRRRQSERVRWVVVVVQDRRGRVLLFKRPEKSTLLAGMWELPNVLHEPDPARIERALAARYGGRWRLAEASEEVRHSITYRSLFLQIHHAEMESEGEVREGVEAAWVDPAERDGFAVSSMVDKVLGRALRR